MSIPNWLKKYLDDSSFEQVKKAIAKAESQTSGEIVPVIIRASSTTDHVGIILILAIFAGFLMINPVQFFQLDYERWMTDCTYAVIAVLLSKFFSNFGVVKRMLTSPSDRNAQVRMRAEVEFYQAGLNRTEGQTGILVLVSMLERQVVVLADKAIAEKLPESTWSEVVGLVATGIKSQSLSDGLCKGLEKCGEILAPHFPIAPDDINEIKDQLIIRDY